MTVDNRRKFNSQCLKLRLLTSTERGGRLLGVLRYPSIRRKQCQSALLTGRLVKGLGALEPRRPLAVVDFAEIQHVAIYDAPSVDPPLLGNAPVPMLRAVFDAPVALQIYVPSVAISSHARPNKVCTTAAAESVAKADQLLASITTRKIAQNRPRWRKTG